MEIRNIAIIAHVDHGKTTLTDGLLEHTNMIDGGVSMDSNDIEKERGITIYAKNTSVMYKGTKINILDTPGHADFGSEVERVLRSVDSVYLIVDAAEGPMPQTKFVLKKSLELGLKPMLIINKIDKPAADIDACEEAVYELFFELGANDEQLDFPTIYAIGRDKKATISRDEIGHMENLDPVCDLVLDIVPNAATEDVRNQALQAQVFNLAYDNFLGRMGIVRMYKGSVRQGQEITLANHKGERVKGKVSKLFTFEGLEKVEVTEAHAGDIVMIAGFSDIYIGQTLVTDTETELLPEITIDEPTISLSMFVNDSPFAGKVGSLLTSRQIRERLERELEVNVGLRVDFSDQARFKVYGRGELHLAVLIENMRREGFELAVSQPEVITKEIDGVRCEPFEEVSILVPEEFSGAVIEKLGKRKGIMQNMEHSDAGVKLSFLVPTRGLMGYRNEFTVDTKGEGILTSVFHSFNKHVGSIERSSFGSMISMATGKALGFSLANLGQRGVLYIEPNTEVYEGQVIGYTSRGDELQVNPTKGKQLTNMRASGSDEQLKLSPPFLLSLERGLGMMSADEYLEITPDAIRLRKSILNEAKRKQHERGVKK